MVGALLSFCLMAVGARELSGAMSVFEMLLGRSVVGLLVLVPFLCIASYRSKLRSRQPMLHIGRNIFHFAGQYGWFLGIGLLPLAQVFALEFTVPLWVLLFSPLLLGEKITRRKVVATAMGVVGVNIVLETTAGSVNPAIFVVLAAATAYALSHIATKALTADNSAFSIIFYMCLIQLPVGLVLSWNSWIWPAGLQWGWIGAIGLTALSAHFCMASAFRYAEATTVVVLDFFRLPLIALLGVLLYSESLQLSLFIGAAVILLANIVNVRASSGASPGS